MAGQLLDLIWIINRYALPSDIPKNRELVLASARRLISAARTIALPWRGQ